MSTPTRAEYLALLGRAVSRLATPHSIIVQQRTLVGEPERRSVTRDPLIVMLRESIYLSSSSGHGGGGDEAKVPLNGASLEAYRAVRKDVQRVWQGLAPQMIALPKTWPTHLSLIQWHTIWLPIAVANPAAVDDESVGLVATIFDQHRTTIESLFNPPQQITLYAKKCPRCGKDRGLRGGDSVPALLITIDPLGTPRAACRACNHVWDGKAEVEQLRRDIRDAAILASPDDTPMLTESNMDDVEVVLP